MRSVGFDSDWHYGTENNKFILYINSASQKNVNFRDACVLRAKEIYMNSKSPTLGLSGGLDSQLVLNCFYSQNLKIDCVFRYFKGYNDIELNNIKILEKRYGFKTNIIEFDPEKIKDYILKEYENTKIPLNQLIYKEFIKKLADDVDIIQGIEGPNVVYFKDQMCYLESYNSFEFSRRRAIDSLNRSGKFISFEKNSNVLLSILNDEIYQTFLNTYNYFLNNKYGYLIDYWDIYVKPYIYYKFWKNDLIYFPKYQGVEGIDWIINGPGHKYREKKILISIEDLKKILTSNSTSFKKITEN